MVAFWIQPPGTGFPLDDAWIHLVYGRELSRSGLLAYNPGISSTGATSPLWAFCLAAVHLLGWPTSGIVLSVKMLGLLAVLLSGFLVYRIVSEEDGNRWVAGAAACLLVLQPDLVAAALSGMEVTLTGLILLSLVAAGSRSGPLALAGLSAVAVLARPETSVVAPLIPLLAARGDRRRALRQALVAAVAVGAVWVAFAIRNVAASGLPLPATYYAKFGRGLPVGASLKAGCLELLPGLGPLGSPFLLIGLAAIAAWSWWNGSGRSTGTMALSGALVYFLASFIAAPPIDPPAFYHQRYALPALFLVALSIPLLLGQLQRSFLPGHPRLVPGVLLVLALASAAGFPARLERITNDSRNIDDVQVAVGRSLSLVPAGSAVWAVDAGAIRYFGNAFVVDTLGLNTPQVLGPNRGAFLQLHPPAYLEVVPLWSALDGRSMGRLSAKVYNTRTPYTVTSFPRMSVHYLFACDVPGLSGSFLSSRGPFPFSCAVR